jgi:hypothetical protein
MLLSSNVHALRIPFTVSAGPVALARFVYAYIIVADRAWLVDTGVANACPDGVLRHPDHCRSVGWPMRAHYTQSRNSLSLTGR